MSASGLTKSFDDRILFEDLSFVIENGMRMGIVGGNGSGKSTLFRILSGELKPDAGEVDIGCARAVPGGGVADGAPPRRCRDTVKMGVVAQSREDMNAGNTVYQEIAQGDEEFQARGDAPRSPSPASATDNPPNPPCRWETAWCTCERTRQHSTLRASSRRS